MAWTPGSSSTPARAPAHEKIGTPASRSAVLQQPQRIDAILPQPQAQSRRFLGCGLGGGFGAVLRL